MSCFISGLDIRRKDKCMVLPMLPNERTESLNDRAFRYFKPFCFPIRGEYDDYGSLDKIQKDFNTAALEAYFEMPIESIVDIACTRRHDLYGSRSTLQKEYGVQQVVVTRESLATIHFTTDANGVVTHPMITWALKCIEHNAFCKEKPVLKIYWKDKELVLEGWTDKPRTYKEGEDATSYNGFVQEMHRVYNDWLAKKLFGTRPFIFGIPSDKQDRAELLSNLKVAFIRQDVYTAFSAKAKSLGRKHRSSWDKTDWETKRDETYTKIVTEYQKMVRKMEDMKAKKDSLSTAERERLVDLSFECRDFYRIWQETPMDAFKSTYSGTEFLSIYLAVMLTPEFRAALDTFSWMEYGLTVSNTLLMDAHSLEQHGDVDEEVALMETCLRVGKALQKKRRLDF